MYDDRQLGNAAGVLEIIAVPVLALLLQLGYRAEFFVESQLFTSAETRIDEYRCDPMAYGPHTIILTMRARDTAIIHPRVSGKDNSWQWTQVVLDID